MLPVKDFFLSALLQNLCVVLKSDSVGSYAMAKGAALRPNQAPSLVVLK